MLTSEGIATVRTNRHMYLDGSHVDTKVRVSLLQSILGLYANHCNTASYALPSKVNVLPLRAYFNGP